MHPFPSNMNNLELRFIQKKIMSQSLLLSSFDDNTRLVYQFDIPYIEGICLIRNRGDNHN